MYCPKCGKETRRSDRDPRYMVCDNCRKKYFRPIEDSYELVGPSVPEINRAVRDKCNPCIIISLVLSLAYLIYCAYYWQASASEVADLAGQIGFSLAKVAAMPHIIAVAVGFVFNAAGVALPNRWMILVAAIVYVIALILFPLYFMFVILQIILSFVGFGLMVSSRSKRSVRVISGSK